MISLQTNVNSLVAQQNLNTNSIFQSKTIEQLTSGYRINSSGDDAAGLAVANKYRSSVAELTQGVANGNDGVASLQIMDGGISNIGQMLDRLKTLAMQSASGSFTGGSTGRAQLNSEFQSDITEINRQAQSIGLNQGGTFAQNLAVYLGSGSGSDTGNGASATNAVVNVDLSKATVDSQSLGLQGVQATNSSGPNMNTGVTVQAIVNQNQAALTNGYSYMTFTGPGFGDSNGVKVAINMTGVGSTDGLVEAVNAALQGVSTSTGAGAAFQAANITASITSGGQLAFNSSNGAFTVKGNDAMANALLGSVTANLSVGSVLTPISVSTGAVTVAANSFSAAGSLVISGLGMASSISIAVATTESAADVIAAVKASTTLQAAGITVTGAAGGKLSFDSGAGYTGDSIKVSYVGNGTAAETTNDATKLGLQGGAISANATYYSEISGGAFQASYNGTTTPGIGWVDQAPGDSQTVTVTANDSSGGAHPLAITLSTSATTGTGTGSSIDAAIDAINTALQKSNDTTLQQVVAVKENASGTQSIQFVSTLSNFSVAVGSNTTQGDGIKIQANNVGETLKSLQSGTGGTADISTMSNAQTAVTAITAAVGLLGTAQANVGKGENQLNFAISLAQSQITNFSAAEANIRDANVAQEAANLTKAQVLQQASIAAMAQANSAPQAVLTLLRG